MIRIFGLILISFLISFNTFGQKYGHCNLGELLKAMPESEDADKQLAAYREQLFKDGQNTAKLFQQEYAQFITDVQQGKVSPKVQNEKQLAFEKRQQEIILYEQEVIKMVTVKRDQLLKPLVDKAMQAIAQVSQEYGFVMVFDTSIFNAVLFAQTTEDILPLVKKKLGIQ